MKFSSPSVRRVLAGLALLSAVAVVALWRWAAEWLFLIGLGTHAGFTLDPADSVTVPVQIRRNLIFVPAHINGHPSTWILDSGLQFSVLNSDRAGELGIELQGARDVPSSGTTIAMAFAPRTSITIGHATFRPQRLPAIQLKALEPFAGARIDGILGHDLLAAAVTRIGYRDSSLTMWAPSYVGDSAGAQIVPVAIRQREAFVDVALEGMSGAAITTPLKLDTGSPTALGLPGGLVSQARLLGNGQSRRGVQGVGLTGTTQGEAFLLRGLRLAGERFDTVLAYATPADSQINGGVLGGEILRHFSVTFDYPRARLLMRPAPPAIRDLEYDRSGATVIARGPAFDSVAIYSVEQSSPAARAGLGAGDVMISVNGTDVTRMGLPGVIAALSRGGASVALLVMRRGVPTPVSLQLPRHYPEP